MIRWGFLGAGRIAGMAVGPAVHAANGALLYAAAARDPERAAALGPLRTHAGYAELLADDDVDAVYISLPNDAHVPWALAALRAGKHVLCEKPLGMAAAEVDQVAAASAQAGRQAVEASFYRWHPRIRLAQQRLAEIGRVSHVAAGFTFGGVPAGDFRLDAAKGGGAMYDVGCYAVSACLWAVGLGRPDEVVASARFGPTGVDLQTRAVLSWNSGPEAEVHAGIDEAERQWLVITGERGEIELRPEPFTGGLRADCELWLSNGSDTERVTVPATDAYRVMIEEFSSAAAGGPGWLLPLEFSRQVAHVIDQALLSAGTTPAPHSGPS